MIFMDAIIGTGTVLSWQPIWIQLNYCHGCLYGYWNSIAVAAIWALIQQYRGCLCGTGSVLAWLHIWVLVQ
jgi:hypothetical protein